MDFSQAGIVQQKQHAAGIRPESSTCPLQARLRWAHLQSAQKCWHLPGQAVPLGTLHHDKTDKLTCRPQGVSTDLNSLLQ